MPARRSHRRRLRRGAWLWLTALVVAAAGCGGGRGGEPITVAPEPGPEVPAEPRGPLEAANAGPAIVSMTAHDVREALGEPDGAGRAADGSGVLRYELADGTLTIHFDGETELMDGYTTDSRALATHEGIRVGDLWPPVARALEDQLTDLDGDPAGESDGSYLHSLERPGTVPAVLFEVRGGRVVAIAGGTDPPGAR